MGTWTLARWQRAMAAAGVLVGAALNVAIIVFHLSITTEGTTAIVALVGAAGVFFGFILFAGDSTSNAEVHTMARSLASTEYIRGRTEGLRLARTISGRPSLPDDKIEPMPRDYQKGGI